MYAKISLMTKTRATSKDAKAKAEAEAAEERGCTVNERLSQSLSRIYILKAQISSLRSKQTQVTKSLDKKRQRASESRQEHVTLKEEADTHKGHSSQLKEGMTELKRKLLRELQEALTQGELLQQGKIMKTGWIKLVTELGGRVKLVNELSRDKNDLGENG